MHCIECPNHPQSLFNRPAIVSASSQVSVERNLLCRYIFTEVGAERHTTSPNKEAVNGKRPLEGADLGSDAPNKRPASAQPATSADPGLLQKLHKANNVRLTPLIKAPTHFDLSEICKNI